MIVILPILVLSAALVYVLSLWRKAQRATATARRAMLKAREQRDTAQIKSERAEASAREIRPMLNLPENVKLVGFTYSREGKSLGNSHCVVIELDQRFLGSGAGASWKAATDEALRYARQQAHFRP